MKKILFFIVIAALFCGCDTPEQLKSVRQSFVIFRYVDEEYKDYIITVDNSGDNSHIMNGIYNFPKLKRDEPYFGGGETYDICELATEEKVIALHDHYYAYYPYPNIHGIGHKSVRNGKWKDICDTNPLELPILCHEGEIYSEGRCFEGFSLDKITKKKREELTIDDIVNAINKVIDEGKLDKYSVKFNFD